MIKKNYIDLIKIFLTTILFISFNFVLVNSNQIVDKNNICTSEDDKNANYTCYECCCVDNDPTSINTIVFKATFFNLEEKFVIYLNHKSKLIDPKSNSPPAIIFS